MACIYIEICRWRRQSDVLATYSKALNPSGIIKGGGREREKRVVTLACYIKRHYCSLDYSPWSSFELPKRGEATTQGERERVLYIYVQYVCAAALLSIYFP